MAETPKKIPDLDRGEGMVQTTVLLPQKYFKKLGELAEQKETSKGALVRTALKNLFDAEDKIINPPKTAKVSETDLKELLIECSTLLGGFEIEDEEGFIALAKEEGIKLEDLTDAQFERVVDKLAIGYEGYADQPTVDEMIERLSELEPTEKQKDLLREALGGGGKGGEPKPTETTVIEEETW